MHLHRSEPRQERCGTSQPRSGSSLESAARSGSSRGNASRTQAFALLPHGLRGHARPDSRRGAACSEAMMAGVSHSAGLRGAPGANAWPGAARTPPTGRKRRPGAAFTIATGSEVTLPGGMQDCLPSAEGSPRGHRVKWRDDSKLRIARDDLIGNVMDARGFEKPDPMVAASPAPSAAKPWQGAERGSCKGNGGVRINPARNHIHPAVRGVQRRWAKSRSNRAFARGGRCRALNPRGRGAEWLFRGAHRCLLTLQAPVSDVPRSAGPRPPQSRKCGPQQDP
jgi:hypothetical protein